MALTQMQLIQSLGEALAWFERELNWGIPPTELRHLCGRIGELYVALITNGQMATEVNQRGYDVVSKEGQRISVKTTATTGSGWQVAFNPNTLEVVDRIVVLRVNTEEMQIEAMFDRPLAEALPLMSAEVDGKRMLYVGPKKDRTPRQAVKAIRTVSFQNYVIRELENGTIELEKDGVAISPVKPELRIIAVPLNISLVNSNGNHLTTRQLGSQIIKTVQALSGSLPETTDKPTVEPEGSLPPDRAHCEDDELASDARAVKTVTFRNYTVRELETGTIEVDLDGLPVLPAKPALREIAMLLNLSPINEAGAPFTTRQLGTRIIRSIQTLAENSEQFAP